MLGSLTGPIKQVKSVKTSGTQKNSDISVGLFGRLTISSVRSQVVRNTTIQ